jgi:hypothetical protein
VATQCGRMAWRPCLRTRSNACYHRRSLCGGSSWATPPERDCRLLASSRSRLRVEGVRQFVQLRSGVFSWINAFWAVDEEDGNARGD